jgi:hypothetical protein
MDLDPPVSDTEPEPLEPTVPSKRRYIEEEDGPTPKKVKFEQGIERPLALLTNSPASVRDRLSDIQTEIITNRRLLDTVQRKSRKSASDKTREARFLSTIKRLEAEKQSLTTSLPTSTVVRDVEGNRILSIAGPVKSSVISILDSPGTPAVSQQPVASGSGFKFPIPEHCW